MVYFQVEDVQKKFDTLEKLEKNGWKHKAPTPARKRTKVYPSLYANFLIIFTILYSYRKPPKLAQRRQRLLHHQKKQASDFRQLEINAKLSVIASRR